jgi:hypothetical protein
MQFNQPTVIHEVNFSHPFTDNEEAPTPMTSPIKKYENDATNEWGEIGPLYELDLLNDTKSDKYSTVLATDFKKLKLFAQSYQNDDSYYLNESSSHINANFEDCLFSSSSSLSPSSSTETLDLSGAIETFDFVQPFVPHPRLECRNSQQKPGKNAHYLSPLRAKLTANQLLQYELESDFHSFMTRFHCLPHATQFKFEVNIHINDHYAIVSERLREEELERERLFAEIEQRKTHLFTTVNHEKSLIRSMSLLTITEE